MSGSGLPCGARKFLRKKCIQGCIFASYFCLDQGSDHFAAIHKVFGASNASKLLAQLPENDRYWAVFTLWYENQARLHDPIYGCVSHMFSLEQQVICLQIQIALLQEFLFATSCPISQGVPNWVLPEPSFGHIPYGENGSFFVDDPNPIDASSN
ncbi:LOB domain-containing protein 17-like [Diospyros lotus]|uniref:LOB domain-containing protein 17-like n=1 Tax=Diospyros lotus TaxID=55363 RepID=UPI00224CE7B6|nr:LOB domain-containing protein 17-like [Diospyros lotus]